jgi:hypothetical protein
MHHTLRRAAIESCLLRYQLSATPRFERSEESSLSLLASDMTCMHAKLGTRALGVSGRQGPNVCIPRQSMAQAHDTLKWYIAHSTGESTTDRQSTHSKGLYFSPDQNPHPGVRVQSFLV